MAANRAFFAQEALDLWLADGRVSLEGETLRLLPEGIALRLSSGVSFLAEVAGGGDVQSLVGKVKSLDEIAALTGEHAPGSVVLGDDAYEVADGFVAELVEAVQGHDAHAALVRLAREG